MGKSTGSRRHERRPVERGAPAAREPEPEWARVLHRVPPPLREKKKHVYDPCVVSLGPYHHGQPHLGRFEEFKDQLVNLMLREDKDEDGRRQVFRRKILKRIDEIRHFYEGVSRDKYPDEELAEMILRDACLLLYYVELSAAGKDINKERVMLMFKHLGLFQLSLMECDCLKLENQIPWWVLKSLAGLIYGDDREMIRRFLSLQTYGNYAELKRLPWDDVEDGYQQPLHLLEALRNTSLRNLDEKASLDMDRVSETTKNFMNEIESGRDDGSVLRCKWWRRKSKPLRGLLQPGRRPFRSVTELKEKGVYFKPSSTFLLDIGFTSYYFFGVLHLPVMVVSKDSVVAFSNMVALEISPGFRCYDSMVTSYLALMKSMVDSTKDVKALQEKGIIVSFVDDDQEIVRMLKEMDSCGDVLPVFDDIKMRINDHCNNKAKTWMAELINTNFRSPWTVIALAAAAFLFCLTALQTYYTIHPRN